MPDLTFEIVSAAPARDTLTPAVAFEMRLSNRFSEQAIHAVLLRCQIQMEVARRRYTEEEQRSLRELFDEPARWGDTLRPLTWANLSVHIPAFEGNTVHSLIVPCSFDLSVATAKYFHALSSGDVPLSFLFSGSVFHAGPQGELQVAPISWNKEARFRLPAATWKSIIDLHYPNAVCLNIHRDVFDELYRFKQTLGAATFEEAIRHMISIAERERPAS
jgi:hypothetical protein